MKKSVQMCLYLLIFFQLVPHSVLCETDLLPNDPVELGIHYLELELYDKAYAAFDAARKQEPSSGIYCYIGIVLQEQNRLSEAVDAYQKALTYIAPKPIHSTAHLHLGIVYKAQGKLQLAETHLNESLVGTSDTVQAYIHLGETYLLQHQLEEAEKAYRHSIQLNPIYTESYYGLGRVKELQNNFRSAIHQYRLAIEKNPYVPDAYYRLSLLLRRINKIEDAEAALTDFKRMKDYSDNVHRFRETIYKNPNSPILYLKLGELHEQHENLSDSIRVYQTAITLYPTYIPVYHSLGKVLIEKRELEKATAVYNKIAEIQPTDVQAYLKLGVIYINRSQYEHAIVSFKQAINVDKTSAEAYNNLARVYAGLGEKTVEAVELAMKAIEISPISKYYDTLAYSYYRNKQYSEALEAIEYALTLTPGHKAYESLRSDIQEKIK
ncbi:tetratricopeptide repeat protein [Candidatus Poribacteria bacterium]|nr:tetratricopeptide repeat protein [Candidatus Poribacteria bacterium]